MIEFLRQGSIRFNNMLHWKGSINRIDVDSIYAAGSNLLQKNNIEVVGPIISCVHNEVSKQINNQKLKFEYYVPIAKRIMGENDFDFLEELVLNDCLICRYRGDPMGAVSSQKEIKLYLKENGLRKSSVEYTVFWGKSPENMEVVVDLVFEVKREDNIKKEENDG